MAAETAVLEATAHVLLARLSCSKGPMVGQWCQTGLPPNPQIPPPNPQIPLIYTASSTAWATVPIAAPGQFTASLGSIQNFGGYLGGALAPTVTGFIVQETGRFSQALLVSAFLTLLAAGAYLLLVRRPILAGGA